ncbi:hypothetical protein OS189_15095 [Sulfitobacter sp. F26169L]|uniref:hypothetical protein n=1 Tax=Sulfitobacter sp. F26169L TaxID=2996015 RepID=UPI002260E69C|nr:hypothetical protein [Sulfitobacter sp. F26169L]MCX7567671.1 hypothetical protein [Sulfitobacter sp. F26169L]
MRIPHGRANQWIFHTFKARMQGGETILVSGASGGVGSVTVQHVRAQGGCHRAPL